MSMSGRHPARIWRQYSCDEFRQTHQKKRSRLKECERVTQRRPAPAPARSRSMNRYMSSGLSAARVRGQGDGGTLRARERNRTPKQPLAGTERGAPKAGVRSILSASCTLRAVKRTPITAGQSVSSDKVEQSRELRRAMTPQESALWQRLRNSQLGHRFRRQQIIDGFIADFFCAAANLVVEVDGPVHDYQRLEDAEREATLRERGLDILRIKNDEVSESIDAVIDRIRFAIRNRLEG